MLKWVFGADTNPFRKGLEGMRKQTASFSGDIRKMLLGAFATTAIIAGFKKVIASASNLQEAMSKSKTVFGEFGDDVQEWSKGLAQNFGQSQSAALGAAASFGAVFNVLGLTKEASAEMSKELVELASDMASFHDTTPQEALDAIAAGLRGTTTPLRRFAVLLDDAALRSEAFDMGIYNGVGALSAQTKALAAHQVILRQTASIRGDFTKNADQVANSERVVAAQMEDQAAAIGNALLPAWEKLLSVLKGDTLGNILGPLIDGITLVVNGFQYLYKYVVAVFDSWKQIIGNTIFAVIEMLQPLKKLVFSLFIFDLKGADKSLADIRASIGKAAKDIYNDQKKIIADFLDDWEEIYYGPKNSGGDDAAAQKAKEAAELEEKIAKERKSLTEEIAKLEEESRQRQLSLTEKILELEEKRRKLAEAAKGDDNQALMAKKELLETDKEYHDLLKKRADEEKKKADKKKALEKKAADEIAKLKEQEADIDRDLRLDAMGDEERLKALQKEQAGLFEKARKAEAAGKEKEALQARIDAKSLSSEINGLKEKIAGEKPGDLVPTIAASSLASVGGGGNAAKFETVDTREQKKVDLLTQIANNTARSETGERKMPEPVS